MPRLLRLAVSAVVVIPLASGCAATISAGAHVDRAVDFSRYETFDWGPADALPTGDPRLDRDPDFQDHMLGAVERGLASRGMTLSAPGTSDLLVHYHANVTERFDADRFHRVYGYCGAAGCPPEPVRYEAGTLVVDVIDSRTHTLVWRGWARTGVEELLRDSRTMAKTIDRAVDEMLQQMPRAR
jgi:hypothetical protein